MFSSMFSQNWVLVMWPKGIRACTTTSCALTNFRFGSPPPSISCCTWSARVFCSWKMYAAGKFGVLDEPNVERVIICMPAVVSNTTIAVTMQ